MKYVFLLFATLYFVSLPYIACSETKCINLVEDSKASLCSDSTLVQDGIFITDYHSFKLEVKLKFEPYPDYIFITNHETEISSLDREAWSTVINPDEEGIFVIDGIIPPDTSKFYFLTGYLQPADVYL